MKKPTLSAKAFELMARIAEYVAQYDCRGVALKQAASDELDGVVTRDEVDELVRMRLLSIVRFEVNDPENVAHEVCGGSWTVDLTERAVKLFWPDRAAV